MISWIKIIFFIFLFSCKPQKGTISQGGTSSGATAPNPSVTSLEITSNQLIIYGSNLEGVTSVAMTSNTRSSFSKTFNVISKSVNQLIAVAKSAVPAIPVDIALNLILSNAYGQSSVPIEFELPPSSVSTPDLESGAVTTDKISDGAVTPKKFKGVTTNNPPNGYVPKWNDVTGQFYFAPDSGAGSAGVGTVTSVSQGVGIVANPNPITDSGSIAVNIGTSGVLSASLTSTPTDAKIPFFNSQNKIVMDSSILTSNFSGLRFTDGSVSFDIFNEGALKIVENGSELFILDNTGLEINGSEVCTAAGNCPSNTTAANITATAPLISSAGAGTGTVNISPGTVNTADNLVQLDSSGKLPASITGVVRGPANSSSGTLSYFLDSTGSQLADSLINYQDIPTMAQVASETYQPILSGGNKTLITAPYTIPNLSCLNGQILKADSSGNFQCANDAGGVISFNSRTGAVVSVAGDYSASQITNIFTGTISSTNVQGAIDELGSEKLALAGGTMTGTIVTNIQSAILLGPYGMGTGQTGEIRFEDLLGTGLSYVGFKAPDTVTGTVIWTLPSSAGTNGQVLTTSLGNVLSWTTISGGTAGIGDVVGPASSTANDLAQLDATGKIISDSGISAGDVPTMVVGSGGPNRPIISEGLGKTITSAPYTIPAVDGLVNQVLQTNGLGVATWASITATQVTNTPAGNIATNTVQGALNELDGEKLALAGGTMTGGIITSSQNAFQLGPYNTAAGNTGEERFMELVANGTNYVGFKAPDDISANIIWTLPAEVGASGTFLTTNGSNVLSWTTTGVASGVGDVVGPATATSGRIASYNGSTGKLIQDGGILAADIVTGPASVPLIGTLPTFSSLSGKAIQDSGIEATTLVAGPASATNTAIPRFSGTGGKSIQNSGVLIDNSNNITGVGAFTSTGNMTFDINTFFLDATGNRIGVGTVSPNASALLDMTSTTQGFLPPRMTTAQRDAIATPAIGLVIYNTNTNVLNVYNGSIWGAVGSSSVNAQTISYTLAASDCGNTVTFNSAGAVTATVPALSVGCEVDIIQLGAGQVTVTNGATTVANAFNLFKTRTQYSLVTLKVYATNLAILGGDIN